MEKKIIAIDFDGTIVEDAYPQIGALRTGAKEAINLLYCNEDNHIIINTCRSGLTLYVALRFLRDNKINYHAANQNAPWLISEYGDTRKIHADVFIDANNVGGMPAWDKIPFIINPS